MKKINLHFCKVLLGGLLLCGVTAHSNKAFAQGTAAAASDNTVKGQVLDEKGAPMPYTTVGLKGTTVGATADENGYFTIKLPAGVTSGDIIVSSVGYTTKETHFDGNTTITVNMVSMAKNLNEVVVIGYGTAVAKNITGAVATVNEKDFNEGVTGTATEMITGKVAGVVVTSNGGAPGGGASISIRGINSVNLTNQPLIVIDGVPISRNTIAGAPDPLSTIDPDEVETFTILKDAASCSIYGDRGSNGVILITTKHGKAGKLKVDVSSTTSLSKITKYTDVMGADAFRAYVSSNPTNLPAASAAANVALLGTANTNWQKQIYQDALSTDNTIGISGGIKNLPYRLSFTNFDQDGILKTSSLKRQSVGLNLSPTFFNNSLKVTLNFNGTHSESRFANTAAIGDAVRFDPTQPVHSGNNAFGGYYTWLTQGNPNIQATSNPLADLNDKRDISDVNRGIGNIQVEYALPSFPELRAVVNGGLDMSEGNGYTSTLSSYAANYNTGSTYDSYKQYNRSDLLDAYLNYKKEFKSIRSSFDATAGYGYQDVYTYSPATITYYGTPANPQYVAQAPLVPQADSEKAVLISYYARLNYAFHDKYLISLTDREDYSSRVSGNHRGNFASVAGAWKLNEENFLKDVSFLSQLKLRASWGQTGNAEIGNYQYIPNYGLYTNTAQYAINGVNTIPIAPYAYNYNIKWETVTGTNYAVDYGFFNNRITGSIEYYDKKSTNLLMSAPVPALANLSNIIIQNIGELTNKGVEFSITAVPVVTKDINWSVNFNIGYDENKITKLYGEGSTILTGGISGGTSNSVQIDEVGKPVNSFYVNQQVYSANGRPVEGLYVTQANGTNLYTYKSPNPTTTLGFGTTFSYKKWSLFASLHADFNNYVYNNVQSNLNTGNAFVNSLGFLANGSPDVLNTKFVGSQYLSDYYIQNASFLRMDNIALTYNFGKVIAKKIGLKLTATCQNVFVITKYTGVDPEINGGIDNNNYPRPRIYSLGIKLNF